MPTMGASDTGGLSAGWASPEGPACSAAVRALDAPNAAAGLDTIPTTSTARTATIVAARPAPVRRPAVRPATVRPATVRPGAVRPATVRPAIERVARARPATVRVAVKRAATTLRPRREPTVI